MAQTGFSKLLTYKSDTATSVPTAGNLTNSAGGAELAVNTADKRLFVKDSGNNVVELGTNPSSLTLPNGTANGVVYANGSKVLTTGSALTFDGGAFGVSGTNGVASVASTGTGIARTAYSNTNNIFYVGVDNAAGSGYGAANCGILYSVSNPIAFFANASEQMRLTSTGLGIGTSSINYKLDLLSSSSAVLNVNSTNANGGYASFQTNGTAYGYIGAAAGLVSGGSASNLAIRAESNLVFATNTNTERMRLDSSGNLGLGVTPSDWASSLYKVLQVSNRGAYFAASTSSYSTAPYLFIGNNAFSDVASGAGFKYVTTNSSAQYRQTNGEHAWFNAPSGTAGNAISFTQAMTLDASGNLGIGTSSPGAMLDVVGNIYCRNNVLADVFGGYSGGNTTLTTNTSGTAALIFKTFQTERMRIDSSGNVGIGTSSPSSFYFNNLVVGGTSTAGVTVYSNDPSAGTSVIAFADGTSGTDRYDGYIAYSHGSQSMRFYTNAGTERMRIDSSGNVQIGTTAASSSTLAITSNSNQRVAYFYLGAASSTGTAVMRLLKYDNNTTTSNKFIEFEINQGAAGSGQINANGANAAAFGSYSDSRLKENITDLPSQLANILALRPTEFDYIESEGGGHQIGFIAQEMQEVYPDVVGKGEDGMLTITGWSKTEARLVKAIQELKAELDATKAEVAALKG